MRIHITTTLAVLFLPPLLTACHGAPGTGEDAMVTTRGQVEVTAELLEIRGKLIDEPMYDYAFVMKYRVLKVHRGQMTPEIVYVGHYNPCRRRSAAADARTQNIGGTLARFRAGDVHRMALEVPIEKFYMGGIINRYFGESNDPIYWAVWTNAASRP